MAGEQPTETSSKVIIRARKDWKKCADAEEAQRKAILACKEFRALNQWPAALKLAREGAASIAGQPPQPARPCLVVDRLSQPCRQVSNQIKNADFGFDVMPNGTGADIETAEILKGYLRRVQNLARGESPIEWAADGAIEGGLGWFGARTDYVHQVWTGDPKDPEAYDQELCLRRIPNNLSVYCDPSSMHPTRRDALFMFVVDDMDRDAYIDEYGDKDVRGLEDFQSTGDMAGWVTKDRIRVAEYWRVEFKRTTIRGGVDGKQTREVREPIVKGSIINAVRELKPLAWVGTRIPLWPILGEELNVDGKPVLRGVITMGMDAQRMVNYTYSAAIEIFALQPKRAPFVPAESVANYKKIWDTKNLYNYAWIPYDAWNKQGQQLPAPIFDTTEAPIQASVALMQVSEEAIKASTSTGDASLGNTNPNERSGKALQALQAQSDLANSNYADNVRRAMIDFANEACYVIPKITRPGQIVHIMGMDDKPEQVMIGKPYQAGPDGRPQAAPAEITPELAKLKESLYKFYDPAAGTYAATVTIGKASATKQEEGAAALGELIPHLPPEMQAAVMPDYVKQLSFSGAQGIAEKLEGVAAKLGLNVDKDGQQAAIPPQVQAQMQAMQQALQEAQDAVKTDRVKVEGSLQETQLKAQADVHMAQLRIDADMRKAQMDNAARIEVARISAGVAIGQAQEERLATGIELQHDAQQAALDRAHQAGMSAMSATAQAGAQAADQQHGAEQAEADRRAASESQAQAEAAKAAEGEAARQAAAQQAQEAQQ